MRMGFSSMEEEVILIVYPTSSPLYVADDVEIVNFVLCSGNSQLARQLSR